MNPGPPRRRRARPVADAPVDELLARADDLAKGWLLAALEDAPLAEAHAILGADLPQDGPRICSAILRALADETDLRRLESGGSLEPLAARAGELVGARHPDTTARAVQALQSVLWTALREELSHPDSDQVSELAERLALVIELVRGAALRRSSSDASSSGRPVAVLGETQAGETGHVWGPGLTPPPTQADETEDDDVAPTGDDVAPTGRDVAPTGEVVVPTGKVVAPARDDVAVTGSEWAPAGGAGGPPSDPGALWRSALEDEVARASRTGSGLALLLADLDDAERVLAVEPAGEARATFGRFAQAVRGVVRRQDILACETDARAWIISRDTGRAGARALAGRIASAVGELGTWRGAPLQVSVGVAVLGEDGSDSAGLVDAAEEACFAAAASGIGVVHAVPSGTSGAGGPGGPDGPAYPGGPGHSHRPGGPRLAG